MIVANAMVYFTWVLISLPLMGLLLNLSSNKNPSKGAQWASISIATGLVLSLVLFACTDANKTTFYCLGFKGDSLAYLMTSLIFLVSTVVHQFSLRYMAGDRLYQSYFYKLSLITFSAAIMTLADNLVLFFSAWSINNLLLISLMIHKRGWIAAVQSGKLACKTLLSGATLLILAMVLMVIANNSLSISKITSHPNHSPLMLAAALLCIITAMTQSALWPFHRWLTSSLNSPTPVSALMHAGLVNGGGFLLVRFSPLLANEPLLLNLIFLIGLISAILGTLWKLVQSDVKRMLACSTLGQMGFMLIQCGLGLFPAAVAHLIWHGLFKAFLFLNAGSAVMSKKANTQMRRSTLSTFIINAVYGLMGAYSFAYFSHKPFLSTSTSLFLVGFAFMASTQVAHVILQNKISLFRNTLALLGAVISGAMYGSAVHGIESALPAITMPALPINALHLIGLIGFLMIWLGLNLKSLGFVQKTEFWKRAYMALLNGSQPHPSTITSIRQSYHS